jgi:hypothetical protein
MCMELDPEVNIDDETSRKEWERFQKIMKRIAPASRQLVGNCVKGESLPEAPTSPVTEDEELTPQS